jgi:hypothetical protein
MPSGTPPSSPETSGGDNPTRPPTAGPVGGFAVGAMGRIPPRSPEYMDNEVRDWIRHKEPEDTPSPYGTPLRELSLEAVKWVMAYEQEKVKMEDIPPDILELPTIWDRLNDLFAQRLMKSELHARESDENYDEERAEGLREDIDRLIRDGHVETRSEGYARAWLNSDIDKFLNGREVNLRRKILKFRDGTPTDELSLANFREGKYDENARYVLRALLGDLAKTGSKTEKTNAIYFAKNLIDEIGPDGYPECDETTYGADAMKVIIENLSSDIYPNGSLKPKGYQARGFTRKHAAEYADKVSRPVKDMFFGSKEREHEKALSLKKIGLKTEPDGKGDFRFVDVVEEYNKLNNGGKSRIDAMIEFTSTLIVDKGNPVLQGAEGSDQYLLVDLIHIYKLIEKKHDVEALKMLTDDKYRTDKDISERFQYTIKTLKKHVKRLYRAFNGPRSMIGQHMSDDLAAAIREFLGDDLNNIETDIDDGLADTISDDDT